MITITQAAQEQIRNQVEQQALDNPVLRFAAKPDTQGGIDYALGFDDPKEDDNRIAFQGFDVVISPISEDLLDGITLDFVEYEPEEFRFIFFNPNDPRHEAPDR